MTRSAKRRYYPIVLKFCLLVQSSLKRPIFNAAMSSDTWKILCPLFLSFCDKPFPSTMYCGTGLTSMVIGLIIVIREPLREHVLVHPNPISYFALVHWNSSSMYKDWEAIPYWGHLQASLSSSKRKNQVRGQVLFLESNSFLLLSKLVSKPCSWLSVVEGLITTHRPKILWCPSCLLHWQICYLRHNGLQKLCSETYRGRKAN